MKLSLIPLKHHQTFPQSHLPYLEMKTLSPLQFSNFVKVGIPSLLWEGGSRGYNFLGIFPNAQNCRNVECSIKTEKLCQSYKNDLSTRT